MIILALEAERAERVDAGPTAARAARSYVSHRPRPVRLGRAPARARRSPAPGAGGGGVPLDVMFKMGGAREGLGFVAKQT